MSLLSMSSALGGLNHSLLQMLVPSQPKVTANVFGNSDPVLSLLVNLLLSEAAPVKSAPAPQKQSKAIDAYPPVNYKKPVVYDDAYNEPFPEYDVRPEPSPEYDVRPAIETPVAAPVPVAVETPPPPPPAPVAAPPTPPPPAPVLVEAPPPADDSNIPPGDVDPTGRIKGDPRGFGIERIRGEARGF